MDGQWSASQIAGDGDSASIAREPKAYPAGDGQEIVVYVSAIADADLDPALVYADVAADAARRAEGGQQIVSMTAMPVRTKSPYTSVRDTAVASQFAVAVLYRRTP